MFKSILGTEICELCNCEAVYRGEKEMYCANRNLTEMIHFTQGYTDASIGR